MLAPDASGRLLRLPLPARRPELSAPLPISLFLASLAKHFDRLILVGRLDTEPGSFTYRLADDVEVFALPHYHSLANPLDAMRATAGSMARFWRLMDDVDGVWLLGPHPLIIGFALIAWLRRRAVYLGVRQHLPDYARFRHPRRRSLHLAAEALQASFRLLSRRFGLVVVGDALARDFPHARRRLTIMVTLVRERDLAAPEVYEGRDYGGELRILSVGRLDPEKNPLLLAEVIAELHRRDTRWRLTVCGDGALASALAERLSRLGVADAVDLRGHVHHGPELFELYRSSHAFLHVSFTEGMPQVLLEAFAARLPVVATAVGGVAEIAGEAALTVPPGDARAAADALERIGADAELRARMVDDGFERVRRHTHEAETARLARFLHGERVSELS